MFLGCKSDASTMQHSAGIHGLPCACAKGKRPLPACLMLTCVVHIVMFADTQKLELNKDTYIGKLGAREQRIAKCDIGGRSVRMVRSTVGIEALWEQGKEQYYK